MNLGENIKRRREQLKLSQECVAERLGVSRQAVSKWETGLSEPTTGNLIQLAEVFEMFRKCCHSYHPRRWPCLHSVY